LHQVLDEDDEVLASSLFDLLNLYQVTCCVHHATNFWTIFFDDNIIDALESE
jgi:hypothetical protein